MKDLLLVGRRPSGDILECARATRYCPPILRTVSRLPQHGIHTTIASLSNAVSLDCYRLATYTVSLTSHLYSSVQFRSVQFSTVRQLSNYSIPYHHGLRNLEKRWCTTASSSGGKGTYRSKWLRLVPHGFSSCVAPLSIDLDVLGSRLTAYLYCTSYTYECLLLLYQYTLDSNDILVKSIRFLYLKSNTLCPCLCLLRSLFALILSLTLLYDHLLFLSNLIESTACYGNGQGIGCCPQGWCSRLSR